MGIYILRVCIITKLFKLGDSLFLRVSNFFFRYVWIIRVEPIKAVKISFIVLKILPEPKF